MLCLNSAGVDLVWGSYARIKLKSSYLIVKKKEVAFTCVDAGTVARDTTPGRLYCVVGVCGARTPGRRFRATR